jgi:hypothetical protein
VDWVFSPLDKELDLLSGDLAPVQQEHLVELCTHFSFGEAVKEMRYHHAVQTTEETARRITEHIGSLQEALQTAQVAAEPESEQALLPSPHCLAMSADGAMVSLIHRQWAEIRTMAIGEPQMKTSAKGEREIHVGMLSYFSRLTSASRFTELLLPEMRRRKVMTAAAVCAVTDGAEWCQGITNVYRPDAVRILDFPHAMEHIARLLEALERAGVPMPTAMLDRCAHILKHGGPRPLLRLIDQIDVDHLCHKELHVQRDYLRQRESMMQYPEYQCQGWPIGDGMVESANAHVIQARLKGAGMHWKRDNVNPMLALRNSLRNDRWEEMWVAARTYDQQERIRRRLASVLHRGEKSSVKEEARKTRPSPSSKSLSSRPKTGISQTTRHRKKAPAGPLLHTSSRQRNERCPLCGAAVIYPTKGGGGHNKRYCSPYCRKRAHELRLRMLS